MITLKEAAKRYSHFMKDPDKVIKIKPGTIIFPPGLTEEQKQNAIELCKQKYQPGCPHCKFIEKTFCGNHPMDSNRNYWHMTEVFVYLHNGKDYCNWSKK